MKRREFIAGFGGAAAWPLAVRAQRSDRVRRIGVLLGWSETQPEVHTWLEAFKQELMRLGWLEGRNVQIDVQWSNYDNDRARVG